MGGWQGPKVRLDAVEKTKICIAGNRTHPVAIPTPDDYAKLLQNELPAYLEGIPL
jgi:hypothetical protein